MSCAFLLFPLHPINSSSCFSPPLFTVFLPLQVLASFRRQTKCPFLSVLQFSSSSDYLKRCIPAEEQQYQRVRCFFFCFFSQNMMNLVSKLLFFVLINVCVYPAGVCKPSRYVCRVCWAVSCRFLWEGSEAAVSLLWSSSKNQDVELSCQGISCLHSDPFSLYLRSWYLYLYFSITTDYLLR